jgi:hypothetical protein
MITVLEEIAARFGVAPNVVRQRLRGQGESGEGTGAADEEEDDCPLSDVLVVTSPLIEPWASGSI